MKRVIRLRKEYAGFNEYRWISRDRQVRLCHDELNQLYHLPRSGKLFLCISTKPVRGAWHLTISDDVWGGLINGLPEETWIVPRVQRWFINLISPAREAWVWFENGV